MFFNGFSAKFVESNLEEARHRPRASIIVFAIRIAMVRASGTALSLDNLVT